MAEAGVVSGEQTAEDAVSASENVDRAKDLDLFGVMLVKFLLAKADRATATFERNAYGTVLALVLDKIPVTGPKRRDVGVQVNLRSGVNVGVSAVVRQATRGCETTPPAATTDAGVGTEALAGVAAEAQTDLAGDVVSAADARASKLSLEEYKRKRKRNEEKTGEDPRPDEEALPTFALVPGRSRAGSESGTSLHEREDDVQSEGGGRAGRGSSSPRAEKEEVAAVVAPPVSSTDAGRRSSSAGPGTPPSSRAPDPSASPALSVNDISSSSSSSSPKLVKTPPPPLSSLWEQLQAQMSSGDEDDAVPRRNGTTAAEYGGRRSGAGFQSHSGEDGGPGPAEVTVERHGPFEDDDDDNDESGERAVRVDHRHRSREDRSRGDGGDYRRSGPRADHGRGGRRPCARRGRPFVDRRQPSSSGAGWSGGRRDDSAPPPPRSTRGWEDQSSSEEEDNVGGGRSVVHYPPRRPTTDNGGGGYRSRPHHHSSRR